MSTVGILALQGCVSPHIEMLHQCGAKTLLVRNTTGLTQIERLIIPGGESTTMLKLIETSDMFEQLQSFCETNPVWGICAGAILLAKDVINSAKPLQKQRSLAAIELRAERNFYGSQQESFKAVVQIPSLEMSINADFIRAPKLVAISERAKPFVLLNQVPVSFIQDRIMVSAFHTELGNDTALHSFFLSL